ncbi:helix-turn-helix domain-containing protein [uncultured Proteiniphilum sp.]|uniref:AraC family transcriptional regulator n=1 Tax=uncultured Proteiniphilum sp. TaxID=497637 RepID=UPI0026254BCF|nr:helix-turn-helix domain-containing protein [uncultured Proteiniphilum sp.]
MAEKIADGFKNEKAIILPYNVRDYLKINNVTRHLHVTHIGYYPEAKYHFRERKNGAGQNILIYCESGKGWIIYNGEKIYLDRNQVFILPENEAHAYGADTHDPWSIYWIHFQGEETDLFSSIIGKKTDTDDSHSSRPRDRIILFEEMFQNLEMGYNPENLEYVSYCLSYFLASIKYVTQFREIKNVKEMDVVQKSILFMKNNLEENVELEEIAHYVGYSPSHFGNIFLKKTSYTPMGYYNQLKIQRACSYLQFSDLKIKEIAFRLGYYDPFHFSKAFKKETRLTPKEYRRKYNP